MIAEEYNSDAKRENRAKLIVAKELAKRFRIEHRLCDPTRDERLRLGLTEDITDLRTRCLMNNWPEEQFNAEVRRIYKIREEEWLRRITPELNRNENILFICGAAHLSTFSDLLIEKGYTDIESVRFVAPCLEPLK